MASLRLLDVKAGAVRVAAVAGSAAEEQRLSDLGLHMGARLEVVQHGGPNGMLVAVNDSGRLVVDAATARAVLVVPLEPALPPMTIAALRPGERGRIVGLGRGDLGYRQRLMAMGLTPGVEFELTRVAPLGDPVEIKVRGFAMSLRKAEAELLRVEKRP
jgi:ferrous iron transport protein A